MDRWATFDCYGTLVDWNAGLAGALGDASLLARYHEVEPVVQAETPGLSYREVLRESARRVGVDADPAETLPGWPVFGDVRAELDEARSRGWPVFPDVRPELETARSRGWRLAILSNSDRDLIESSIASIGVPFDLAIVASEIGSYKPAHRHWHAFAEQVGRLPDVHVAQSHFHDVVPASALALPTVWINRLGERAEPAPTRALTCLIGLADTLDELAPPS